MAKTDLLDAVFADLRKRRDKHRRALATYEGKAELLETGLLPTGQAQALAALRAGARRLAIRCPRKTGKSWWAMVVAVSSCLRVPEAHWVIIGLTRPSIQQIYWKALQKLAKELELGCHFQHTALVMNFPNGSAISLTGADNRAEIEKLRGPAYHGAIVDECKSYNPVVLRELLDDVLSQALKKDRGPLILIGTPGNILAGPFFEATAVPAPVVNGRPSNRHATHRGHVKEGPEVRAPWELHTWTQEDNTAAPWIWEESLQEKLDKNWPDDNPSWRREALGEWVAADNVIVYRYQPARHDYDPDGPGPWGLPHEGPWSLVMGIDLGSKDPSAIVVWAYSSRDPALWEVHSEKRQHQNGRQIAEWVAEVEGLLGQAPEARVVDQAGLATMFVDTLAEDYGLVLEPAEKREKLDHIELVNTDLDQLPPRIRIRRDSPLSEELLGNRWLETSLGTERIKEDPRTPNDLCDAALYSFRFAQHRRFVPQTLRVRDFRAVMDEWRADQKAKLIRSLRPRDGERPPSDTDWWA